MNLLVDSEGLDQTAQMPNDTARMHSDLGLHCPNMPETFSHSEAHMRTVKIQERAEVDSQTMIWDQGPVVQSVISLMSLLRVISLTVWADSIYNILIFFAEKMWVAFSYSHFFSKKFQHICVSLDVNFNESLTNDIVSFEQLGPD